MNIRNIAELIILQCIEDLWNKKERSGSADFFTGEGFSLCAGLAGMDLHDQGRLLNMVGKTMVQNSGTVKSLNATCTFCSSSDAAESFVPDRTL